MLSNTMHNDPNGVGRIGFANEKVRKSEGTTENGMLLWLVRLFAFIAHHPSRIEQVCKFL